ncbi:hypothetical protein FHR24_001984 [Wenyingzhuangia heitensis]|uniref:Type 1 periplasmic binding fold superfamily protein n=1 Tax=Wenyingzhuangia heitensis TaxID=1487859 RepID=A0ABX0UDA2_9FLAO|nr:hypothetical protein [Wenyingzhuangia heitensis]NIJ45516.1 hypothetical protein [Wenyingzhuangia heitensis]
MKFKAIIAALVIASSIVSCEKDDPVIPNEPELIANVTLTLTPEAGGEDVVFHWHDENGDGVVDDSEKTEGSLDSNTVYTTVISLNGEDEDHHEEEEEEHEEEGEEHDHEHGDDIDAEVKEEGTEHQFFYTHQIDGLTVLYTDKDENGKPIGLETTFTTGESYTGGAVKIVLRHEPNKFAEGVANGDVTNAGGENDVDITFDLGLNR